MSAKPFLFDLAFDTPEDVAPAATEAPPEPQFSAADINDARNAGYADGVTAGQAEAAAQFDQSTDQLLRFVIEQLGASVAAAETAQAETTSLLPTMTVAAIKKAFPALAQQYGQDEILSVVRTALQSAMDEPRIVVRLSDTDFEPLEAALAPLPAQAGFPGRLVTLSDMNIASGDVRVEWADGGLIRDLSRITNAIADALSALSHEVEPDIDDQPDTAFTEETREGAMTNE